jgi:hypothetical protein
VDDSSASEGENEGNDEAEVFKGFQQSLEEEFVKSSSSSVRGRGRKCIMTPKLAAVLDKTKVTDRDAVRILVAAIEALGLDTNEYILNHSSFNERRRQFRENRYREYKESFQFPEDSFLVVHWDGKMFKTRAQGNVERQAVIATWKEEEQLLGIPESGGSGNEIGDVVFSALVDWGINDTVQALGCDTTTTNTGWKKGACITLERLLKRDLLYLPCRHHVYEVMLKGVFDEVMGPTSGPDTPIFKRFFEAWPGIDKNKFESGISDEIVKKAVEEVQADSVRFLLHLVEETAYVRDDYKEFAELSLLFLNVRSDSLVPRPPGPIHHARWMAKGLYSLKIFLFRNVFKLTTREINQLRDICIFIIRIYVKAWFRAPFAIEAPLQDLNLIKALLEYEKINKKISQAALKKLKNHLWYLSSETVAFGLFDDRVPIDTKKRMALAMFEEGSEREEEKDEDHGEEEDDDEGQESDALENENNRRNKLTYLPEKHQDLDSFVSNSSRKLLKRFKVDDNFLLTEPSEWNNDANYRKAREILSNLKVVNDVAERNIKLISDYHDVLTKNENQKQCILQIVSDYRKRFPDSNKSTLQKQY